jgi:hypothetical protein
MQFMKMHLRKNGPASIPVKLYEYIQRSKMRSPEGVPISAIPITEQERKELREMFGYSPVEDDASAVDQFGGIDLYEHKDAEEIRRQMSCFH